MPQTMRCPPPPAPRPQYLPTSHIAIKSPSSESEEDNLFDRLETTLIPSKNVLVEGRLEESTGRPMTYLDTKAIMETRLSFYIDRGEAGFYDAGNIYILAVDGLNTLKDVKAKGADNFDLPSEELLQKCKEESAACLEAAILHCSKMEHETPAPLWEKKETWALERERLRVTLLHGEDCTIWKGKDPLNRKRIGWGILSFGGFISFSVKVIGEEPQYFKCRNKDILSGKIKIEKSAEMEGKAGWQVITS